MENIDDNVMITPWHKKDNIPVFLRNIYAFYEMPIMDTSCVLIEIIDELPGVVVLQKTYQEN